MICGMAQILMSWCCRQGSCLCQRGGRLPAVVRRSAPLRVRSCFQHAPTDERGDAAEAKIVTALLNIGCCGWMLEGVTDNMPHIWQRLRRAHGAGGRRRRPGLLHCLASWPCPTLSGLSTALQHMSVSRWARHNIGLGKEGVDERYMRKNVHRRSICAGSSMD